MEAHKQRKRQTGQRPKMTYFQQPSSKSKEGNTIRILTPSFVRQLLKFSEVIQKAQRKLLNEYN